MYKLINNSNNKIKWRKLENEDHCSKHLLEDNRMLWPSVKRNSRSDILAREDDPIRGTVDALLVKHQKDRVNSRPPKEKPSTRFLYRRDSYSTIETSDETPLDENSTGLVIRKRIDEYDNIIPVEISFPTPDTTALRKFPSTSSMPKLQKSKKYIPDYMAVDDFYEDDTEEEIVFVPRDFELHKPKTETIPASSARRPVPTEHFRPTPTERVTKRPVLLRGTSSGLQGALLPSRTSPPCHSIGGKGRCEIWTTEFVTGDGKMPRAEQPSAGSGGTPLERSFENLYKSL